MCDASAYMHLLRSTDKTLSKKERKFHKKMYKIKKNWWYRAHINYARKLKIVQKFAGTKYRSLVFAYNWLNKKTFCEFNIKQDIMSYIRGEREAVALPVIKRAIALSYARTLIYKIQTAKGIKEDFCADVQGQPNAERQIKAHNKICDFAIETHKKALKNIPSALWYKARKCDRDKKWKTYRPLGWYAYKPPSWNDNKPYKKRKWMVRDGSGKLCLDKIWYSMFSFREDFQLADNDAPLKKGEWTRRVKDHSNFSVVVIT